MFTKRLNNVKIYYICKFFSLEYAVKKFYSLLKDYLKKSDTFLLVICVISTLYGIVLITSATAYTGSMRATYVQIAALLCGIFLYFIFSVLDIDILADRWKLLFLFSVLFILSLIPFGVEGNSGNKAWIRFAGIGIQPAEVVKITFIILLAKLITHLQERHGLSHIWSMAQLVAFCSFMFVLIIAVSSDLGSALVYAFIFAVMLYIAGLKFYWFLIGGGLLAAVTPLAWRYFLTDRQKERILAPFDPTIDPTGLGIKWQPNQSKAAISSGGLFGKGLFNGSYTQSGSVPHQETDFVFSAAGEELGLIGCALIILLLTIIIVRCVYIGIKSNHSLGSLVCIGIAAMLAFQTCENIGMCLGLTPVIGLTLPFFSYGGSSIITMFAAMGIVSGIKMKPRPSRFTRIK